MYRLPKFCMACLVFGALSASATDIRPSIVPPPSDASPSQVEASAKKLEHEARQWDQEGFPKVADSLYHEAHEWRLRSWRKHNDGPEPRPRFRGRAATPPEQADPEPRRVTR